MSFWDSVRLNEINSRAIEELCYEQVAEEIARGFIRQGLWAKALSDAIGDEQVAKSLYLKYRVQSLIDECALKYNEVNKIAVCWSCSETKEVARHQEITTIKCSCGKKMYDSNGSVAQYFFHLCGKCGTKNAIRYADQTKNNSCKSCGITLD